MRNGDDGAASLRGECDRNSGQCAVLRGRKFAKFYLQSFDGIIFHVKCYLRNPDGQILRAKCYLRNPDGQILHQNNAPNFQTDKF